MKRFLLSAAVAMPMGIIMGTGTALKLAVLVDETASVAELLFAPIASHVVGCGTSLLIFSICYFWKTLLYGVVEGATIVASHALASVSRLPK